MLTPHQRRHFQAGQAPTCWQKQIGRAASRVHKVATACAWLEKLAVTRPQLRTTPLLGRCLEAVANQEPPVVVAEAPVAAPKPSRVRTTTPAEKTSTAPQSASDEMGGRRQRWTALDHQARPRPALTGPKRADRTLLHRLAGQAVAQRQPPKSAPVALPPTAKVQPVPAFEPAQAKASLSEQITQRAARRLRGQSNKMLPTQRERASSNDETAHALTAKAVRLAQQWAQPLQGPRAAAAQLHYWAQRQPQGEAAQSAPKRTSAANRAAATEPANVRTSIPGAAPHRSADQPDAPSAAAAPPNRDPGVNAPFGSSLANQKTAAERTDPFNAPSAEDMDLTDSAPLVAPPQIAQKLPKLTAPQASDLAPAPIAAVTARQSALSNLLSDDDLGGLAANIKRILDAEARRYGIDV
ncbi:MAG: hypothetical protein H6641_25030 [Caldilineaceae bacterium]|nr:hypothetical protein [Caldilineaceae bacterium]